METNQNGQSSRDIEKALTSGALNDLKKLLDVIRGRTTLLSNSVNPDSPLQKHFSDMIEYLNESIETTEFLKDSFELDHLIKETK